MISDVEHFIFHVLGGCLNIIFRNCFLGFFARLPICLGASLICKAQELFLTLGLGVTSGSVQRPTCGAGTKLMSDVCKLSA